jgi:hypothetical protein
LFEREVEFMIETILSLILLTAEAGRELEAGTGPGTSLIFRLICYYKRLISYLY